MEQQEDMILKPVKKKKMRSDFLERLKRSREEKEHEKDFLLEAIAKEMKRGKKT